VLVFFSFTVLWCASTAEVPTNLYEPQEIWYWNYAFTFQLLCYNSVLQGINTKNITTSTVITMYRSCLQFFEVVNKPKIILLIEKSLTTYWFIHITTEIFCY